jgi:hypothetical protein
MVFMVAQEVKAGSPQSLLDWVSVSSLLVINTPLSWNELKAYSTPAGEAEAGNAGEPPVKE